MGNGKVLFKSENLYNLLLKLFMNNLSYLIPDDFIHDFRQNFMLYIDFFTSSHLIALSSLNRYCSRQFLKMEL